jgi:hypothetical protein
MKVAILIDQFTPCVPELRYLWNRWDKRGQLIDWDLARDYFRPSDTGLQEPGFATGGCRHGLVEMHQHGEMTP